MSKESTKKLSVIGLGKLGACYMAFYASKGYSIIGYDTNKTNVDLINKGLAPVKEPGLSELITKNKGRIRATHDLSELISETDLTFIILPTPSMKNGLFSVDYVTSAAKSMGAHLKNKKNYHIFVLVSTVLPGNSHEFIIPAFEKHSGKKHGKDFGYAYSPSLIAIGDILRNLEDPDFVFLGTQDERSRKTLASIYNNIYDQKKPIEQMNIESAELAKISLNSYVTMKITFANILGDLCSRLPLADVDEITRTLGKDRRIGHAYLKSGLGYGGTCFPRDNFAFSAMAKKLGIKSPLALITHTLNDDIWKQMTALILKHTPEADSVVGVLGVSYKPNTTLSEESQAFFITEALIKKKKEIVLHEPLGHHEAEKILGNKVAYSRTLVDTVKRSDTIFISNFDKSFSFLAELLKNSKKEKTIIDPWGMFTKADFNNKIKYISPGRKK